MDDIVYDFSGIDTISGSINAFVNHMNEKLDEVDRTFKTLLANGWQGQGADAFTGCSAKWHASAGQMATTLHSLSLKVGNAAANMAAADAAAAARF
ncbi:MAG TPA: WXG100 family type VII secretion target [Micromonosporaceae bacterium]|jgi:WXG100 family type VII secretion target